MSLKHPTKYKEAIESLHNPPRGGVFSKANEKRSFWELMATEMI